MCDKIKDDDDRNKSIIIKNDPCINNENKILEDCLKTNGHDWRKCTNELKSLQECFKNKNLNITERKDN